MSANYENAGTGNFGFSVNYEEKTMGHKPTRDKDRYGIENRPWLGLETQELVNRLVPRPKMRSCKAPGTHCEEPVGFVVVKRDMLKYDVCKGHAIVAMSDSTTGSIIRL